MYNILFVKNRYTKKLNLKKYGVDWFKTNLNIDVITEEISTDFDLFPKYVSNASWKGWVADGFFDNLRKVVPENKYHAVVFIYGNDLNKIRVSATNIPSNLYPNTELIQLVKLSDKGKTLNHEMFHAFFAKAIRRGAVVLDTMDEVTLEVDC